jgi:hypothetical protein
LLHNSFIVLKSAGIDAKLVLCHFDSKSTDVLHTSTEKCLPLGEVKELRRKLDVVKAVYHEVDHILCIVTNCSLSMTEQALLALLGDDMCIFAEGPGVTLEAMFGPLAALLSLQPNLAPETARLADRSDIQELQKEMASHNSKVPANGKKKNTKAHAAIASNKAAAKLKTQRKADK